MHTQCRKQCGNHHHGVAEIIMQTKNGRKKEREFYGDGDGVFWNIMNNVGQTRKAK